MASDPQLLLSPSDIGPSFPDWEVKGVLNPGGIRAENGKIVLYARVAEAPAYRSKDYVKCPVIVSEKEYETASEKVHKKVIIKLDPNQPNVIFLKDKVCKLTTLSHLRKIVLDESGYKIESLDKLPTFVGRPGTSEYGVEDGRITKIDGTYYMTYVTVSDKDGVSTSLAESKDLTAWKRRGLIFQEQNKDVVLFPEKINGLYVALNRPESAFVFAKSNIWISYSKDLVFWGKESSLLDVRKGSWETERNGAGPPPIKTKQGWLLIYHGVSQKRGHSHYSAGAVLLDLKNPEKILARTPKRKPLMVPSIKFEKKGFMNNVVFPTAAIPTKNGKELLIYSGGADSIITVRKISLEEIFLNMEPV
ncbi:MAG: glycosidase [archaeon]